MYSSRPQPTLPSGDPNGRLLRLAAVLALTTLGFGAAEAARADRMISFTHVATEANTSGAETEIDHPVVNGRSGARIFLTQNWNPDGALLGPYNDHAIGARFEGSGDAGRWRIYNEDGAAMPEGAGFNVVVADDATLSFLELTEADDIVNRANALDCEYGEISLCGDSEALLVYSHVRNPLGISGSDFDHPSSILYGGPTWSLVTENQPLELMPGGVFFWFLVGAEQYDAAAEGRAFRHTSTEGSVAANHTLLGAEDLVGRPTAVFLVVRNGPAAENNPQHFGVYYDWLFTGTWAIFLQDESAMEVGERFHVFVPPAFADDFESGELSWWADRAGTS